MGVPALPRCFVLAMTIQLNHETHSAAEPQPNGPRLCAEHQPQRVTNTKTWEEFCGGLSSSRRCGWSFGHSRGPEDLRAPRGTSGIPEAQICNLSVSVRMLARCANSRSAAFTPLQRFSSSASGISRGLGPDTLKRAKARVPGLRLRRATLYRRFAIGRSCEVLGAFDSSCAPQVENLRYSRLQICATLVTAPPCWVFRGSLQIDYP
jgi:hypothetical protein